MTYYDIDLLDFEEMHNSKETYFTATLEEFEGMPELVAVYDIQYGSDPVKAHMSIGNPNTGEWSHSSRTKDWPVLDKAFGREKWQNFLEEKSREAQEELNIEDEIIIY